MVPIQISWYLQIKMCRQSKKLFNCLCRVGIQFSCAKGGIPVAGILVAYLNNQTNPAIYTSCFANPRTSKHIAEPGCHVLVIAMNKNKIVMLRNSTFICRTTKIEIPGKKILLKYKQLLSEIYSLPGIEMVSPRIM
jgi:hypothetical protein